MSRLGDRLLLLVMAATALGGLLWWVGSYIDALVDGPARVALLVAAGAVYLLVLVGVWLEFVHIDHTGPAGSQR